MEHLNVTGLAGSLGVLDSVGLLRELLKTTSPSELASETGGVTEKVIKQWERGDFRPTPALERYLMIYCMRQGIIRPLIEHGGRTPSYNPFDVGYGPESDPLGYKTDILSRLVLRNLPTKIGGFEVSYPLGVPASTLTGTHTWIDYHSRRGFDILTYRTVRTVKWPAHDFPHWVFVPEPGDFSNDRGFANPLIGDHNYWPTDPANATMANSFGIPSLSPESWQESVGKAKKTLLPGRHVLIVSVIGTTPTGNESFEYLRDDFAKAAVMAKEAGADIVELNLSCPNLPGRAEEKIYLRLEDSIKITEAAWKALGKGNTPLFVKLGYLNREALAKFVRGTAKYINGIVAINTISTPVRTRDGQDFFPSRADAGISGSAIKPLAKEVVRNLVEIREMSSSYEFDIIAVGGVATSQDVQNYLNMGVSGVQSCTGVLMNPDLAIHSRLHTGWVPDQRFITIIGKNGKNGGKEVRSIEKEYPLSARDTHPVDERDEEKLHKPSESEPDILVGDQTVRLGPPRVKRSATGGWFVSRDVTIAEEGIIPPPPFPGEDVASSGESSLSEKGQQKRTKEE